MTQGPLRGLRVLEIGAYISAPYATSLLSSLGAEIVKVERPAGEDFRRGMNTRSPFFRQYNAGKRSLAVDLKHPDGVELVKSLIPTFDVLLENMRPGKVEALGLGFDDCRKLRPDLIYASVSGFGPGGPLADRPTYDTIGQSFGALYTILSDDGRPQLSGTCLADLITGVVAAAGILAAVVERSNSGHGRRVETSLMEAVSALTIDALTQYYDSGHRNPTRQSRHPQGQGFVVQTSSNDWMSVHLSSSAKFWAALTLACEMPELQHDARFATYESRGKHYQELAEIVRQVFLTRSTTDWQERLDRLDVPYAPVLTAADYLNHPQVKWLGLIGDEADGVALVGPPWRFDGERPRRDSHVPLVGEDSLDVAREVCEPEQLEDLVRRGVLIQAASTPASSSAEFPGGISCEE